MRSDIESRGIAVPGPRVAKYYGDRASAGGLQITEATDICLNASAYPGVPGVFTESQLKGWRKVTDAVHAKGGFIFCQLWHTGRASPAGLRGGEQPISSGDLPMSGKYLDGTVRSSDFSLFHSRQALVPYALCISETHRDQSSFAHKRY